MRNKKCTQAMSSLITHTLYQLGPRQCAITASARSPETHRKRPCARFKYTNTGLWSRNRCLEKANLYVTNWDPSLHDSLSLPFLVVTVHNNLVLPRGWRKSCLMNWLRSELVLTGGEIRAGNLRSASRINASYSHLWINPG